MKKYLIPALAISLFCSRINGQSYLDTNNVDAYIGNTPILFWDQKPQVARFYVPKDKKKSTIFSSSPWIGGLSGGNLYMAAETYRQAGHDFRPGPIANDYSGLTNKGTFKITKAAIKKFRSDTSMWSNPPAEIANWPAHGDVSKGENSQLAPFVNIGGDPQKYEPAFGDYPAMKGDMCVYNIMNDDTLHTESTGSIMKIEMHRMVYSFADTNSFLYNTIFVDYRIVNRSTRDYDSVIVAQYTDFDIGLWNDDFVGTDTLFNMAYAYNGDETDQGSTGYGTNPPAEGIIVLDREISGSIFYQNDPSNQGNPEAAADYYNYMNIRWKDGNPLTYGGNGIDSGTRAWYAFSGNPCAQTGWTEKAASISPGDRRMLCSLKPFTLKKDSEYTVSLAFLFARGDSGANSSVCALKTDAAKLMSWYKAGGPNNAVGEIAQQPNPFIIYPNPSDGSFVIRTKETCDMNIYDLSGKMVRTYTRTLGEIRIEGLEGGIYFVSSVSEKGIETKKVIVH